jgi:hypothetical protein
MTKSAKLLQRSFIALLFCALAMTEAYASTYPAASCSASAVQAAINSAASGDTVTIPAGTCTWTSGVTISGKGITVNGAGTSRIIAVSSTSLSLGTGSKTLSVISDNVGQSLSISAGETLTIAETATESNSMTGTVTSYSSGSLVMNVTSSTGSCGANSTSNCKRWMIIRTPASMTKIINNNATDTPLFNVTENTTYSTTISNIFFSAGTGLAHEVYVNYNSGGKPIIIHDCRIQKNPNATEPPSGNADMIELDTNRGLVYNCSFDSTPFNISTISGVTMKDPGNASVNSWTTVSNMGSANAVYVESNDFHGFGFSDSCDDNCRMVQRYNYLDNSGAMATHGADTSATGMRYFESYNNVSKFDAYNDGTTFNLNNYYFIRGGTGLIYNNTYPALVSTDYGNKPDVNATVMNLQRPDGPDPCWGSNHSSNGQYYHAPRQVGFGYVTGNGTATYSPLGLSSSHNDSVTYVGDSEPFYVWANSRSPINWVNGDYGGTACGASPDSSANYIVQGRDYFNGTTAKPNWSSYTYPHPLRTGGSSTQSAPPPPINLQAVPK